MYGKISKRVGKPPAVTIRAAVELENMINRLMVFLLCIFCTLHSSNNLAFAMVVQRYYLYR